MAALPSESPKLLATAIINESSFAELLDRRLKRIEEMKLIEAQPTAPTNGDKSDVPRLADRRFRRL